MAKVFVINGEQVATTVREVCEVLGRKVTKKDILAGLVEEVVEMDEKEVAEMGLGAEAELEGAEDIAKEVDRALNEDINPEDDEEDDEEDTEEGTGEDDNEDDNNEEDDKPEDTGSDKNKVPASLAEKLKAITKPSGSTAPKSDKYEEGAEIEYPEKGTKTVEELKALYKRLTDKHLDDWLELEGLTYTPSDNPGINRMRKCMAITNLHHPKANGGSGKKSKSKYAQYTTEDLVQLCMDNNVEVKDSQGDMRILRMYCIISLRNAGLLK